LDCDGTAGLGNVKSRIEIPIDGGFLASGEAVEPEIKTAGLDGLGHCGHGVIERNFAEVSK
jgi:hypothetical protein